MSRLLLAASAATLIMAAPAFAAGQHGGGQHGGGQAKGQHGGGQGKGQGSGPKMAQQGGGHGKGNVGHGKSDQSHGPAMVASQGPGHGKGPAKAMAGKSGHGNAALRTGGPVLVDNRIDDSDFRTAQLVGGCPPGLAAKNNGCLPPGQAKKLIGSALPQTYFDAALDGPYRSWYRDNDRYYYRMGDGYIYRVDRGSNLIAALIPYVDRNFSYYPVGMSYPSDFNYYNVPYQYQSYYPDGGAYPYRYGDGAIYRLDPQTQAIQSIVALLAGDLSVGQRLPPSYGVYNVPLQYRAQYYDTPNDWYRYNDGYIYRVDPTTQLVTALINAIV